MKIPVEKKQNTASIIVNPVSGLGDPVARRKLIIELAKDLGWTGKYLETTKTITAASLAQREIKRGVKHIVACGGDGTIMEVLETVVKKNVVLGIIPLGTANILARNLSIPLDTRDAMHAAFFGNKFLIDVGRANNKYFSIIAGIGIDASMMRIAERELKDKWGYLAYIGAALKSLSIKRGKYEISLDGKQPFTVKAKTVLVANMGKLIGKVEIVPHADPQSGSLQVGIIKARGFISWISVIFNGFFGKISDSSFYEVYSAKKIQISLLNGKKPFQCDGEYFPNTNSLTIDIFPKSVTLMVTPDKLSVLENKNKKVLLFDFDGTLADSMDMISKIYNLLATKHNYPKLTEEKKESLRGLSMRQVINELPISKLKIPIIFLEGKKEFTKNIEFLHPFPQLKETLVLLSKKYTLGIVTSNDSVNVKKFLIYHNMDYFDFVYSDKSLFGKGKIISDVLEKYGFKKSDCLYVGDEIRDIDAAREAGIKVASVTWGFNSKKSLQQNNPDFILDDPQALSKIQH